VADLDAWGIQAGYHDVTGAWRQASPRTIDAITAAMGVASDEPPPGRPVWIVQAGEEIVLGGRWQLVDEDTDESTTVSGNVRDLAPGYYRAYHEDGRGLRLVVTPGRCFLPAGLRTWGWAVQLYALRSRASWGMGDLADLRRFCAAAGEPSRGEAAFVLVNPLHAAPPVVPQQASPYYPSSRCFRNPLYLRVEEVPGVEHVRDDVDVLAVAGRRLNADRRIDRDAVFRLKMDALTRVFAAVPVEDDASFARFAARGGELLARYATYCVLAETYGGDWRRWPAEYRDPSSFESRQVRVAHAGRFRFHQWLQWLVEEQLAAVGFPLMQDVAIGVDPGGADAWMWQSVLAPDITVGAPPDEYNHQGQDWGLPPFDPWKLRDAEYEPFIQTVRAAFRHAGALRFDHVMGLFRLFWIPAGGSARDGAYVRYPAADLLDILALESWRAGAHVVGEDLGTVEEGVREELARRSVLSYRLFWFEAAPPREWPVEAMAAVTTHDLPTVAGAWTGADTAASPDMRDTLRSLAGVTDDAAVDDVVLRVHEELSSAPCRLLSATIDDALGVAERPNRPGTVTDENWSVALPVPLEEIEQDERVAALGWVLRHGRPGSSPSS
jgi:4-alpha-glucanotransferase